MTNQEQDILQAQDESPLAGKIDFQKAIEIIADARGMNHAAAEVFLRRELEKGTLRLIDKNGLHLTPTDFRASLGAV